MIFARAKPLLSICTTSEVESKILSKSHSFFTEKINEDFGNPRRRQCSVCFILKWRNDEIFQSVTAAFIRELIQLSIQFTKVLWSSNKTKLLKKKQNFFFRGGGEGGCPLQGRNSFENRTFWKRNIKNA